MEGGADRRHIPTWNGNAATWEHFRDEVRIWRMGENLSVSYSVGARMVAGLSGPARTLAMRMDEREVHPAGPDPQDADAVSEAVFASGSVSAFRNAQGLDNIMQVLGTSPLVRKLPARKNELLHAFFRDDSLARRQGEPVCTWLVRYEESLDKLRRVGINMVDALGDIAGWQALSLAGLSEDCLERVVSKLPNDSYPLDQIQAELNRVYATIHLSERTGSGPAIAAGR